MNQEEILVRTICRNLTPFARRLSVDRILVEGVARGPGC